VIALDKRKRHLILFMVAAISVMAAQAFAINAPTNGSFAYDLYDIGVNKIVKGPIGFVGGVMAMVFGAVSAIQARIMLAIPAILGGAALLKAESIVTSLGALI
jgi:methylglyoxal synthase